MENKIEESDNVQHINQVVNGGLGMTVDKLNDDETQASCGHLNKHGNWKYEWFPTSDLKFISRREDGFIE